MTTTTGLSIPCRLIYTGSKYEDCPNCLGNPYSPGGSIYSGSHGQPFRFGQPCPTCGGSGVRVVESTEDIRLCVIWDYKQFTNLAGPLVGDVGSMIQTFSKMSTTIDKIKQATSIIVDTDIEQYSKHRFSRIGEPNPCGFGASTYITTLWEKV